MKLERNITDTKAKKQTLGYYNMAKGFGMLLVIYGHSASEMAISSGLNMENVWMNFFRLLGAGAMAMFFMISGEGMSFRKWKRMKKQVIPMIKPYYITAGLIILARSSMALVTGRSILHHGLDLLPTYLFAFNANGGSSLFGIPIDTVSIFWFIWALALGIILYNAILSLKDQKKEWICSVLCVVAGYLLTCISKVWIFSIPMAMISVGYLAFGRMVQKNNLIEKKLSPSLWLLMLVLIGISTCFGYIDIAYCAFRLGLIDIAASYAIGFLLLKAFAWIRNIVNDNPVTDFLGYVGFNSFWIICIHGFEKIVFPWYRIVAMVPNYWLCSIIMFFMRTCMIFGLLYGVQQAQKKFKKKRRKTKIKLER